LREFKIIKAQKRKLRVLSITSLVAGILAISFGFLLIPIDPWFKEKELFNTILKVEHVLIILWIFFLIVAIICGSIGLKRIKAGLYIKSGRGFDLIGIVLGIMAIVIVIIYWIIYYGPGRYD
jgi:hypothetical protein